MVDQVELRRHSGDGARHADCEGPVDLRIEVKAPYVPVPGLDDAAVLRQCIQNAGGQFRKSKVNVIVPLAGTPVRLEPDQLVKATIGEWGHGRSLSLDPGCPPRHRRRASFSAGNWRGFTKGEPGPT